jgi:hypothetical protein
MNISLQELNQKLGKVGNVLEEQVDNFEMEVSFNTTTPAQEKLIFGHENCFFDDPIIKWSIELADVRSWGVKSIDLNVPDQTIIVPFYYEDGGRK